MNKITGLLFTCLLCLSNITAKAQIQVQGTGIICLGDLAFLSYAPPTGKTVSTYAWDFGNTFTATNTAPAHLYKQVGKYTITLDVKFVGGGSAQETKAVEIIGVPNAKFQFISSDTCLYSNKVCFTDQSTPAAAGQDIVKRAIVWGDGSQTVENNPSGNKQECHNYITVDKFYVEMEVTDNKGCKSFVSRYVSILHDVRAGISQTINYPDCETAEVCIRNNSSASTSQKVNYEWMIDGKSSNKDHFNSDPYCFSIKASKGISISLSASVVGGCSDKKSTSFNLEIDKNPRKLTLSDSVICYGQGLFHFEVDAISGESTRWTINGKFVANYKSYNLDIKKQGLTPGKYVLQCIVSRGSCSQTLTQNIVVRGPVAQMKIYNNPQCGANRRVFFVQNARDVDTANTTFKWYMSDHKGENCTINREKDINKFKNCNITEGWFAKHDYTDPIKYNVILSVTDNKTGCSDVVDSTVVLDDCGICVPFEGTIEICQNELFLPGPKSEKNPVSFSLNSGKTWLPFPSVVGKEYYGLYRVGLVYKWPVQEWAEDYGSDSIRIHTTPKVIYDTFFVDDLLRVKRIISDSVTVKFSASCNPNEVVVHFETGVFHPGESIWVWWGDQESDEILFHQLTNLSELKHQYKVAGLQNTIRIEMMSDEGCTTFVNHPFSFGHIVNLSKSGTFCVGNEVCYTAVIRDYATGTAWDTTYAYGKPFWLLDGKPVSDDFRVCLQMDDVGKYDLALITTTNSGCTDTLKEQIIIQDVRAGIKDESKEYYCRGLRQFFDSSALVVPGSNDWIKKYSWDFGTGNYSSWEKDPIQSFDGSLKQIDVKLAVETAWGCKDTTGFRLIVLTSLPLFTLDDSIGCAPLDVNFTNLSKGSTHFIWEFGDENNETYETSSMKGVSHRYNTPGRYYIRLVGIDSFYHPLNKSIYYCHTAYPKLGTKGLAVTVLPNTHPGIAGPDTLCMGAEGWFYSLSNGSFDIDNWDMGDGTTYKKDAPSMVPHKYYKEGLYTISLDPTIGGHSSVPQCMSKIEKKVQVFEILADFEIDDNSQKPIFDFVNYSLPKSAEFHWDFGQPSSGADNHSIIKHPSHNYKSDTGQFTICLIASTKNGCRDTVCKVILNDYTQHIQTYNAFTPGNPDGFNDLFEIELEGEAFYDLTIYNRWGEIVFESASSRGQEGNIIWDGNTSDGMVECPSGTYYYVMKYAYNIDSKAELQVHGTVTLLRD